MLRVKHWFRKVARLYEESDVRRHVRMPAEYETILNGAFGTLYGTGLDANRDGLGLKATSSLAVGTLVFLKIPALGVMGFAHVRHCSERGGTFHIGLQFREPLARDRETDGFDCRRLRREAFLDWNEADVS